MTTKNVSDVVPMLEHLLVKLKEDPVKLSEEKELQLKTLQTKVDVLEKNYKMAMDYIATLEEHNALLKESQCNCKNDAVCCSTGCGAKDKLNCSAAPCEVSLGICSVPIAGDDLASAANTDDFWDSFWYYMMVALIFYYILLLFSDSSSHRTCYAL